MRPLSPDEVWDLEGYETRRDAFRRAVIALKKVRRVPVGEHLTLVFENRSTLLFQIQEMLRVERLRSPDAIRQEVAVYNELVPGEGELSATLFIEITELADIRPALDRLIGIDEHVALVVGERRIPARFDAHQLEEDRISAVHYLRFSLDEPARRGLADPATPVRLRVDHPAYRAETELSAETRASLLEDLTDSEQTLLPPPPRPERSAADEEIFRQGAARAVRPASPRCEDHVVVEPIEGHVTLLEAGPELLADCQAAVQRVVRELCKRYPRCRVESAAGANAPLRHHVLPER